MKNLLRRIKRSLVFRLLYRLVCWINYPTPRERMWGMFEMGKAEGRREALKELPITQVQPRQTVQRVEVHLPPGEWTRRYRASHLIVPPIVRTNTAPLDPATDFPEWLTGGPIAVKDMTPAEIERVPTIRDLTPADVTEKMPAINTLLHQERQERRERQAG